MESNRSPDPSPFFDIRGRLGIFRSSDFEYLHLKLSIYLVGNLQQHVPRDIVINFFRL